jgi:DUF1680 family protein
MTAKLGGKDIEMTSSGSRLTLERTWKSGDLVEITFNSGIRLVPWPKAGSDMAAVFKGPQCLGLSSADADVEQFDTLLVNERGKPVLSADRRPQVIGKDGQVISRLRPIAEDWQSPNIMNPNLLRILFHLRKNEADDTN